MNIWQFMTGSPILAFLLAFIIGEILIRCWSRAMRHLNIRKHGWPPAHLDADGDFKSVEKES